MSFLLEDTGDVYIDRDGKLTYITDEDIVYQKARSIITTDQGEDMFHVLWGVDLESIYDTSLGANEIRIEHLIREGLLRSRDEDFRRIDYIKVTRNSDDYKQYDVEIHINWNGNRTVIPGEL